MTMVLGSYSESPAQAREATVPGSGDTGTQDMVFDHEPAQPWLNASLLVSFAGSQCCQIQPERGPLGRCRCSRGAGPGELRVPARVHTRVSGRGSPGTWDCRAVPHRSY